MKVVLSILILHIDTLAADEILAILDKCLHDSQIRRVGRKVRQAGEMAAAWIQTA